MLGCAGDCLGAGGVVWLGGVSPLFLGSVVWSVFRCFLGVLTVFAFAFVWCLVLYSY